MHIHRPQYYITVTIKYNLFSIIIHNFYPKLKIIYPLGIATNLKHPQPTRTQITKATQIKITIQESRSDCLDPLDCTTIRPPKQPNRTTNKIAKLHYHLNTSQHHNTQNQIVTSPETTDPCHTKPNHNTKNDRFDATTSHNPPIPVI